jgi:hypothetical protein
MVDEPHAVVKLLVARMESHPEEFERSLESRWYDTIGEINAWGNETDKAAIAVGLRNIRLGEAHEDALDELCNGPDRRRKEAEEAEYERNLMLQRARNMTMQQTTAQQYAQQYQNAAGTFAPGLPVTKLGVGPVSSDMDPLAGFTYTSPFDSIKQALGIKK